jgi:tRNA dimethylallyltransferase
LEAAGLRDAVTASRALGYRQILEDPDTAQEQTVSATRRFARRQRSWFRRDPRITWTAGPEEAVAAALSSVALSVAVRPAVRAATPARGPAVRP